MGKERILYFATLAGMAVQDLVTIIDATIARMQTEPSPEAARYLGEYAKMGKSEQTHIREYASPGWEKGEAFSGVEQSWESLRAELLQEAVENVAEPREDCEGT